MKLFIILSFFALLTGCNKNEVIPSREVNEDVISDLVFKAVSGDMQANDYLSNIIDVSLPLSDNYNYSKVERFTTAGGNLIFTLLLENKNPIYNRFAVYDSAMNLLLVDKSLTGNLSLTSLTNGKLFFIALNEKFISKDTLQIERISLYNFERLNKLSFRTITTLTTPKNYYTQTISELNEERIVTTLGSRVRSGISGKGNVFSFSSIQKKYLSNEDIFTEFVKNEIANYSAFVKTKQITDEKSALESAGIYEEADTLSEAGNAGKKYFYSLTLTEGWREVKGTISENLNTNMQGRKYINNSLGAYFAVVEIPDNDLSENFINHSLDNVVEGKYRVRYSDKITAGKKYLQFFEYSCGSKRYLLFFEVPRSTFTQSSEIYEDIINSFNINC
jgi:hypothetical protein